jgi:hypothetical protein
MSVWVGGYGKACGRVNTLYGFDDIKYNKTTLLFEDVLCSVPGYYFEDFTHIVQELKCISG